MKLMQPIMPKVCNSVQFSQNIQEITGSFTQNQQSQEVIGCMKPPITPVTKTTSIPVFELRKVMTSTTEMGFDNRGEVGFSSLHQQPIPTTVYPKNLLEEIITNIPPDCLQTHPHNDPTSTEEEEICGNSLRHKAGDHNDADQLNTATRGAFCSPHSLHIIFIH